MRGFAQAAADHNREVAKLQGCVDGADLTRRLADEAKGNPEQLIELLEGPPRRLVRDGDRLLQQGKAKDAVHQYRRVVTEYPHSGFADDALLRLAENALELGELQMAVLHLETLMERYSASSRMDKALWLLGNCHMLELVSSTDAKREEALRNHKRILREYKDGAHDWKADVIALVVAREKARLVFALLVEAHPSSHFRESAKKRLVLLRGQ